jgi:hypothetical protein
MSVYCIQFDAEVLVVGLRDTTIAVYDRRTLARRATFVGHTYISLSLSLSLTHTQREPWAEGHAHMLMPTHAQVHTCAHTHAIADSSTEALTLSLCVCLCLCASVCAWQGVRSMSAVRRNTHGQRLHRHDHQGAQRERERERERGICLHTCVATTASCTHSFYVSLIHVYMQCMYSCGTGIGPTVWPR